MKCYKLCELNKVECPVCDCRYWIDYDEDFAREEWRYLMMFNPDIDGITMVNMIKVFKIW